MFGDRIRKLRKEKGLTQEELGKQINVTKVSISGYENGNRTPDTETLQRLADVLETSTEYILGRTENPNGLIEKDERDIAKRIDKMRKDLIEANSDGDGLNFRGEPMSEEAIESLLAALEHAERIATLTNKKYTPKKYRDEK
ncbi:helix-turn-helix domain-containing protein [Metabacillus fastidiosus]|uniref:helix-turn-helix domain-containing protein n=1 Tax=Metabacillus fastidiosus TaxID=1458 RepID=UPI00082554A0|nr:helix-turn-helix domain-containing protein [Metabacillus fastidiosus]MED4461817.1 helix-turn-helix domain-containing protein [Metabacillus fastidiosus]